MSWKCPTIATREKGVGSIFELKIRANPSEIKNRAMKIKVRQPKFHGVHK